MTAGIIRRDIQQLSLVARKLELLEAEYCAVLILLCSLITLMRLYIFYYVSTNAKLLLEISRPMLDFLTITPKFTRPVCCTAAATIDRYLLLARARPQQQTRRLPPLLSIDRTDRRTDTRPFYDAQRIKPNADRVIINYMAVIKETKLEAHSICTYKS